MNSRTTHPQKAALMGALRALSLSLVLLGSLAMQASDATVSIQTTDPLATEGVSTDLGVYTLWRVGGSLSQQLTVNYRLAGSTATLGTDYTLTGPGLTWDPGTQTGCVLFPANLAEISITLAALDDAGQDGNEFAKFQLRSGTGYVLGSPTSASVAIGDTDGAWNTVAVVTSDPVAVEPVLSGRPGSPGVCTFHRAGNVQDALIIKYSRHDAASEVEWTPAPLFYLTFPAGAYTTTLYMTPFYDGVSESPEITGPAVLNPQPPQTGNYLLAPEGLITASVTIHDFPSSIYTLKTVEGWYSYPNNLSVPYAVNNAGVVVGGYLPYSPYPYATNYGFRWSGQFTESGQFAQIGPITPGYGLNSLAAGVNGAGQIVGCSDYSYLGGENVPIFWENGTFTWLAAPSGWTGYGDNRIANALNDSGLIVGTMVNSQGTLRAVKWATKSAQGQDLLSMTRPDIAMLAAYANAVSPNGRIVGKAQHPDYGVFRAFRTRQIDSDLLKLESDLGSLAGPGGASEAWAINGLDEVAGASQIAGGQWRGFVLRMTGGMDDLIPAQGGSWSKAYGINGSGYVVGQSTNYWGYSKASLWYYNGLPYALESLISGGLPAGWTELTSAEAINDDGQIVGWGYKNGVQKAFLLTPIW